MRVALNSISFAASFTVAILTLYFIQYFTIGMIPKLRHWTWKRIYVKDVIFVAVALLVIITFFDFYLPY